MGCVAYTGSQPPGVPPAAATLADLSGRTAKSCAANDQRVRAWVWCQMDSGFEVWLCRLCPNYMPL